MPHGPRQFDLRQESRTATITISLSDGSVLEVVRISLQDGRIWARLFLPLGESRSIRVKARWNAESDQEQWFIDDEEDPRSVAEVGRAILEPALFPE